MLSIGLEIDSKEVITGDSDQSIKADLIITPEAKNPRQITASYENNEMRKVP